MRKAMKSSWVWIVILLAIFVSVSFFLGSSRPTEYPPFLSTSPSPSGVKAFYTYIKDEGIAPIKRLEDAPGSLNDEEVQLLLLIEPSLLTDQKMMKEYEHFLEDGNTIILLKHNPDGMFGIKTTYGLTDDEAVTVREPDGKEYQATMLSETRILPGEKDEVLLEDDLGVIAIKRHFGDGTLIAANSPDWFSNHYILEEDNLNLVFYLLEEENWNKIFIDEYLHQQAHGQGATDIYPMWLLVAALQIMLFTLFWLLYKGKRFGPVLTAREETVRFSDEHITALAAWYQKGKLYHDSLTAQADYLRTLFQEKWGISYQKEWEAIKDQLAVKIPSMGRKDMEEFVQGMHAVLGKQNLSKQEYLQWSKRMDHLRKEVEEG